MIELDLTELALIVDLPHKVQCDSLASREELPLYTEPTVITVPDLA